MTTRDAAPASIPESQILQDVLLALGSRQDVRLFRQNTGVAVTKTGGRVRFGVPGQADLSGVVRLVEHVGLRLEVEVKSARGRVSEEQRAWGMMIAKFGGIYIVTRGADDALEQLDSALAYRRRVLAGAAGAAAPAPAGAAAPAPAGPDVVLAAAGAR